MIINKLASGSSGNCCSISDGKDGTRILIDCGIPIKKIIHGVDYSLSEYSGCLVQHEHGDHLRSYKGLIKLGIPIYWTRGTAQAAGAEPGYYSRHVKSKHCFNIGDFKIIPFDVKHDAAEPVGFWVKGKTGKLMFATDTFYINPRFKGLTHVMIEANYIKENIAESTCKPLRDRLYSSHMELQTVLEFFRELDKSRLREVHLLHLSESRSDAELFKREVQKIVGVPVYV